MNLKLPQLQLPQLRGKQRRVVTVIVLVITAGICYVLIAHGSIRQLRRARSEKHAMEQRQQGLALVEAELKAAEKMLGQVEAQAQAEKGQCCTEDQADLFFENITTWAVDHQLAPMSRSVSSQVKVRDPNAADLLVQFVDIAVQGDVDDLIRFMTMLVERPQKVCIENLHVALPSGRATQPQASFRVILVIDSKAKGKTS